MSEEKQNLLPEHIGKELDELDQLMEADMPTMRATKSKVIIEMEMLSDDTIESLVNKVILQMKSGVDNGTLHFDDGDIVRWGIERTPVKF